MSCIQNDAIKRKHSALLHYFNSLAKQLFTAIAIAMADSVTVSIGEEMRGVFNVIFLVSADVKSFRRQKKSTF